jgi:hypothetical protein
MAFSLRQTAEAERQLNDLATDPALLKRWKAVSKCIRLLSSNPRHPGLHTHEFTSLCGAGGEKVFEAYAENNTPAAYRVFWHYGPQQQWITIIAVVPHP